MAQLRDEFNAFKAEVAELQKPVKVCAGDVSGYPIMDFEAGAVRCNQQHNPSIIRFRHDVGAKLP